MTGSASVSRAAHATPAVFAAGGILLIVLGIRHAFGLYLLPVSIELSLPRAVFESAIAWQNIALGLAQPLAGWCADRYGPGRTLAAGAILHSVGLAWMGAAHDGLSLQLSAGLLVGLGQAATTWGVVMGVVGRLTAVSTRSSALGLVGAVGAFGLFALLPLTQVLIDMVGWRRSAWALAALSLLILPLAGFVMHRAAPAQPRRSALAALGDASRSRPFWCVGLAFGACGFQLAFVSTFLPAWLRDGGLSVDLGAASLAIIGLANVAGTYAFGRLGAAWPAHRHVILAVLYLMRGVTLALFALAPLTPLSVVLFAFVFGAMWLGTGPLTQGIIGQALGLPYVSMLFGFIYVAHQIGSYIGIRTGSFIYAQTGSYTAGFLVAAGVGLGAALLVLPARVSPPPKTVVAAADA